MLTDKANEIIADLARRGISVRVLEVDDIDVTGAWSFLSDQGVTDVIVVDGFYAGEHAYLYWDAEVEQFRLTSRYGFDGGRYDSFADLVEYNYEWWVSSRKKASCWREPDPAWIPHLIEHGYAKKETVTQIVPTGEGK